jgi:hypothetical protein
MVASYDRAQVHARLQGRGKAVMTWPRRQHGDLLRISENVWRVVGAVPNMLLRRQMIVVRDESRQLLLHSAIALDERRMSQLEALGTLRWLVVPNGWHRLDAAAYRSRYPHLVVVTPSGAIPRVREVVTVDLDYERFPSHPTLRFHVAPGPHPKEGVIEVRDEQCTLLVFNDLVFNPNGAQPGAWLYRLMGQGPQVPWLARRLLVGDRVRLRAWLLQLAEIDQLTVVIPGHGDPIALEAASVLRKIAATV